MGQQPPDDDLGPIQQSKFASALIVAALLFVAALVASALYEANRSEREARESGAHEIDALARVFAEQTRRSLQTVDIMLRSVAGAYRDGGLPPLDSRAMHDELAAQRDQFNDVAAVFIMDPQGQRLSTSTSYPPRAGSIARDELIRTLQTGSNDSAYVGEPVRWAVTDRWVVPLVRRLEGPGRRFDGVVVALLDASYFDNFYAAVHLERGTSVALLHEGGGLVSTFPPQRAQLGPPVPTTFGNLAREAAASGPPSLLPGQAGATESLAVARPVPGFAMTVVVSRELREVLAAWHEQMFWVGLRTGILTLMMAALLVLVRRHVVRVNAARAQLRESDQRYALAVAGSNEGLWDWNLPTGKLFFSQRAQELCGMEPGPPLRSRRVWQALLRVHPDDVPRLREEMKAHLRGRRPHFDVEVRAALRRANASDAPRGEAEWSWYRQRGLAIRNERGRPLRMAGSIENIDERKRSERERQRLEVQLRQALKLEAIGTLAGGIAHDFNNILGSILGYAELARSGADSGSLPRYLDGVMNAGQRAKALVERILAFSRSGMGERVPVHVQSVVAEGLDLLLPSLPPDVTLVRTLEAGDTVVIGDATQIHQVVMNLCTNALHAMQDGGALEVALTLRRSDTEQTLTTGELPAGDHVCLTVRDNGQGIGPEAVHRIFDPFFTTKRVGVGTGLGLSLVHGIVTDLGGGIDVVSVPGAGSTFTVWLPWSGRAAAPAHTEAAEIPQGDGERILLVDDEVALVHVGEEMLAALGYDPAGYTSSVEALAAFAADPQGFDAVVSDETMPQLPGSQMAQQIRKIRPDIPIVLMSGYLGPTTAALARQSNVSELLPKPLVSRDIAKALARVFGK